MLSLPANIWSNLNLLPCKYNCKFSCHQTIKIWQSLFKTEVLSYIQSYISFSSSRDELPIFQKSFAGFVFANIDGFKTLLTCVLFQKNFTGLNSNVKCLIKFANELQNFLHGNQLLQMNVSKFLRNYLLRNRSKFTK